MKFSIINAGFSDKTEKAKTKHLIERLFNYLMLFETSKNHEPSASARDLPQTAVKKKPKRLGLGF
ncbi:MAG: hypothetical protein Q7T96_15205 [Methylobacter sp.]|nr:hypothetical protein [Methylobacter sp.]